MSATSEVKAFDVLIILFLQRKGLFEFLQTFVLSCRGITVFGMRPGSFANHNQSGHCRNRFRCHDRDHDTIQSEQKRQKKDQRTA